MGLIESIDVVPIFQNEKEPGNQKRVANQHKTGTRVISPRNAGRTTCVARAKELLSTNESRYSMIYDKLFKNLQGTFECGLEYLIR